MSPGTASAAHLAVLREPGLIAGFGLARARLLLAVGSHATDTADAASDVDFLAIFDREEDMPREVTHAGVVAMPSPTGPNWIGALPDGSEINIEMVSADRLRHFGSLLAPPISATWAPILQSLDIRLLDRIRIGVPAGTGGTAGDSGYLASMRASLSLDRLPLVVMVMNYCGAASHLARARKNVNDPFAVRFGLDSVAAGMTVAALCLHGVVIHGMKKGPQLLRRAEREHPDLPFRMTDLEELWLGSEPRARLATAAAALQRMHDHVRDRAAEGDAMCAEARRGFAALAGAGAGAGPS